MVKKSFCDGWKFRKQGTENVTDVIVPHDAMLHGVRSKDEPSGSAGAYFPGGRYVYEKKYIASAEVANGHALLEFEGVYKNAEVSINGKKAGGTAYGYMPFYVKLDGFISEGENIISVTCDNCNQPDSRWYSGAGIFRPVWLWTGPSVNAIEPGAVQIKTISINPAKICVYAINDVRIQITDGADCVVEGSGSEVVLEIPNAKLWSDENPYLYTAIIKTTDDSHEIRFGIRMIQWSNEGLLINGENTLLRGGCLHHDNGILGAATWDESEWRRARILKNAGYNAIRSAHNPASRALIEACDALGIYVMDETWDMWFKHKSKYDYADQWENNYREDIRTIVSRDYNHPSVIMYSIGNEVSEPARDKGLKTEKEMVSLIHELDDTRPVTAGYNLMIISSASKGKEMYKEDGGLSDTGNKNMSGMNSTMFNFITNLVGTGMNKSANSKIADKATSPALDALDIAGYNYASGRYPMEKKAHPDRIIMGSETFPQDIWKNWKMVKEYPYLIGDFMWTAWDYLGEAGIGAWAYTPDGKGFNKPYPWLLAEAGVFDILGNPTGELFLAQAAWGCLDGPRISVQPANHAGAKPAKAVWRGTNSIPSWSWKGCDGITVVVEVYSCRDQVKLYINDKAVGQSKVKDGRAVFKTSYKKGIIRAVELENSGIRGGECSLISANENLHVVPVPEKNTATIGEVLHIPINVQDEYGVVESNADRKVTVTVSGGTLLGLGSANPRTEERFDEGQYTTYYGRCLAVVRADIPGRMTVTVEDKGNCETAEIEVE